MVVYLYEPTPHPLTMTTLIEALRGFNIIALIALVPIIWLLSHFVAYFADPQAIRSIPGPFLAKFTDAWLGWVSAHGHRSEVVHKMHEKYGSLPEIPEHPFLTPIQVHLSG